MAELFSILQFPDLLLESPEPRRPTWYRERRPRRIICRDILMVVMKKPGASKARIIRSANLHPMGTPALLQELMDAGMLTRARIYDSRSGQQIWGYFATPKAFQYVVVATEIEEMFKEGNPRRTKYDRIRDILKACAERGEASISMLSRSTSVLYYEVDELVHLCVERGLMEHRATRDPREKARFAVTSRGLEFCDLVDEIDRIWRGEKTGPGGICWCPQCGFKLQHLFGEPCFTRRCERCGSRLLRRTFLYSRKR